MQNIQNPEPCKVQCTVAIIRISTADFAKGRAQNALVYMYVWWAGTGVRPSQSKLDLSLALCTLRAQAFLQYLDVTWEPLSIINSLQGTPITHLHYRLQLSWHSAPRTHSTQSALSKSAAAGSVLLTPFPPASLSMTY